MGESLEEGVLWWCDGEGGVELLYMQEHTHLDRIECFECWVEFRRKKDLSPNSIDAKWAQTLTPTSNDRPHGYTLLHIHTHRAELNTVAQWPVWYRLFSTHHSWTQHPKTAKNLLPLTTVNTHFDRYTRWRFHTERPAKPTNNHIQVKFTDSFLDLTLLMNVTLSERNIRLYLTKSLKN